jgi:hypothetical protein
MQKLTASFGIETQPGKYTGAVAFFPLSVGKAVTFFFLVGFARSVHEHLTLQDWRARISVFVNGCLKILPVKAVLVCKTVEFCFHTVMLVLAS